MLYSWIISLPMMVCLFWAIFFAVRLHRGSDEPRITGAILLFYIASTILYSDHWLYFSECPSFVGEWSYAVVNLCVYPFYYAYLLTLTRTKFSIEGLLLFFPAAIMAVIFPFCAVAAIDAMSACMPVWAASLIIGSAYIVLIVIAVACRRPLFIHPFIKLLSKQISSEEELALKTLEAEHKAEMQQVRMQCHVENATRELDFYASLLSRVWKAIKGLLHK